MKIADSLFGAHKVSVIPIFYSGANTDTVLLVMINHTIGHSYMKLIA